MKTNKQIMLEIVQEHTFEIYKDSTKLDDVITENFAHDDKFSRLLRLIVAYGFAEDVLNLKFYSGPEFNVKYKEIQNEIDDITFIPPDRFLPALEVLLDGVGISYTKSTPTPTTPTKIEYDEREFKIDKGVLIRYRGNGGVVTVPNGVTSIGKTAFIECSDVTSITLPDSITSIGVAAFADCSNLNSINLPSNLNTIPEGAFENCVQLSSISIPDSVVSISNSAFRGCSVLSNVKMSPNISSIGDFAFARCTGLIDLPLPDSLSSIGNGAFTDCASLKGMTIPDRVTKIGNLAFVRCDNLPIETKIQIKYRNAQALEIMSKGGPRR